MSVSEKIQNDPDFSRVSRRANRALQKFAESFGLTIDDLADASSDEALGSIVDRLVTIGINAANRASNR